ncbi:formamidopyrimidine-DNA glycosylase [Chitinophaga sp. YR627]|uniref:DNA-formamidopyrimidine glycosylase family protein n=1 Tax=Chitinophaga sp. YR627 TaxID=1881041 RepID=UPI0008F05CA8|nr:DNA-formamidopyrimidine glycosylase family protein [Chitinophaga sp. YR627]SFN21307.1 formamidopyrimidine-DNA glycosylase [Chitinophaga sp. YR627]
MPELPDLQVISKNLNKIFANKKVDKISIFKDKRLNASVEEFTSTIEHQKLLNIGRNGKELLLDFENGSRLGIHLMLKGELHLSSEANIKHKVFELIFEDHTGFAVTDFMGQAKPILNPVESDVPDAVSDDFNFKYFKPILAKAIKANIKKILKDQDIVRGIGNAYIDEILWDARISPLSIGSKIPDDWIEKIIHSTKSVLAEAVKQIENISPNIISGEERSFLKVHTSKPETPTGYKITVIELEAKKTYFTEEQILFQ